MRYKTIQSPALIQGLAHPLRARMFSVLQEREASPKELADHFGMPLSNVAYHIQVLRRLKLIRLVKKTPRRGALEHHYRADYGAHVEHEAWGQTPAPVKERMIAGALAEIGEYVTRAAAFGGFDRENAHIARSQVTLDEEAWDVLAARFKEMLELVDELERASAARLAAADHQGERSTGVVMMMFDSAPEVPNADEARRPRAAQARR